MKEFIQNSNNLILRQFSVHNILHDNSSIDRVNAVVNNNLSISEEAKDTSDKLETYLIELENLVNSIYSAIELKIEFMESYCDSLVANAKEIPINKTGSVHSYFTDVELENVTYIKGVGYILGVD